MTKPLFNNTKMEFIKKKEKAKNTKWQVFQKKEQYKMAWAPSSTFYCLLVLIYTYVSCTHGREGCVLFN